MWGKYVNWDKYSHEGSKHKILLDKSKWAKTALLVQGSQSLLIELFL